VANVQRDPVYEQVAQHYRDSIRSGQLAAGDQLPSTRALASEWKIAISTAQRVLKALRSEGWIETRPGKPSVVMSRKHTP
jgi:DNA-binding transcriptional regulator YhcF (GntR family)